MTDIKPRILFVDDEVDILDGLRRVLRRQRRQWDLEFAEGGREGLARVAESGMDVVVSDMRMPDLDGAQFLREVRSQQPGSMRVVLSGQADDRLVQDAIPVTHRWLHKPCDREELVQVLERLLEVHETVRGTGWADAVGETAFLPAPASCLERLGKALDSDESTAVVACVEDSAALVAKVMQVAHAAKAAGSKPLELDDAISRLGEAPLREIHAGSPSLPPTFAEGLSVDEVSRRARWTSGGAAKLAGPGARQAGLAGRLVDVGLTLMVQHRPADWRELAQVADADLLPQFERDRMGIDRAALGGALLQLWGLPPAVVAAVRYQDRPLEAPEEHAEVVKAVHVAARVAAGRLARERGAEKFFPVRADPDVAAEMRGRIGGSG